MMRRALVQSAPSWLFLLLAAFFVLSGCRTEPPKKLPAKTHTTTELRAVRRGVTVTHAGETARAPYARERLGEGAEIDVAEGGLAWLRRDGGATLLVRGPAKLSVEADGLKLASGRAFAETPPGVTETLTTSQGALVLSAVRASVDASAGATSTYVLEGEVRAGAKAARAGELLESSGERVEVRSAVAWEDWTGGLATTDPTSEPPPFGVGTVGARRPGATGTPHAALAIQRLDVRVRIEGDLAITEVDETFFNPLSETVEGVYHLRIPEGALLERFGVDRDGGVVFGYVKEKAQAQAQYQAHVYAGSQEDPALLAWRAPGVYEARLYPIGPGATRRVVVRYTEWLSRSGDKGERRLYVYPMAAEGADRSAPHIEDLSISIDVAKAGAKAVRSGMQASRLGDVLLVEDHDVVPRADLAIELFDDGAPSPKAVRAKHRPDVVALGPAEQADLRRSGAGEADYVLVPVRASDVPARDEGLDLVIVVDTSAATDKGMLRLARAATRALLTHLGPKDRAVVFSGDDRLEPTVAARGELGPVDETLRADVLGALAHTAPGGATDLGSILAEAASKLGDKRAGAVIYLGDGAPTVGESDLAAIRERLRKVARPTRLFALGIGDGANMALLSGLATGSYAARVGDDRGAARAAIRILELAERSALLGSSIDLGPNVERMYPRDLGAIVEGETTLVVGRIKGDSPKEAVLTTPVGARSLPLQIVEIDDSGDLRRRWAGGRLMEMLDEGAGHAALVDLGVRQGIITPVTSIYVPTTSEMTPEQRAQSRAESKKRASLRALEDSRVREAKQEEQRNVRDTDDAEEDKDEGILDGLFKKKSDSATGSADNKEGGTGTRAKGEKTAPNAETLEAPVAAATATAAAAPSAQAPDAVSARGNNWRDEPEPSPALEPADKSLSPAENRPAPPARLADPAKPVAVGPSGGLAGTGAGGGGKGDEGKMGVPPASPSAVVPSGEAEKPPHAGMYAQGTLSADETGESFAPPINGKDSNRVVITIDNPGRLLRPCGPGADLPFEERRGLWRERLAATGGAPSAVVNVYRAALASCEAPTVRERRALLLLSLDVIPNVAQQVAFYRLLAKDLGAADIVYRGILARVTTPAQVRELNQALGLSIVDSATLEKTLKEAKSPADREAKLRALAGAYPSDLSLALRLLDAVEDTGDDRAAREEARLLRARPDADATVRTAVGELYLRLAARGSDPAQKAIDEREAKRTFGELVEFSPDDPVARRRLGDLYRAHGYHAEATRQYETLARLVPDDPTVPILLAAAANGLGKLEEALRWTEKGGQAGAPDATQGPHATARAYTALFLAWGRQDARAAGKADEVKALAARLDRLLAGTGLDKREGQVRVLLTWAHPELHPTLWHDGLGSLMPAAEGDATLGIAQAMIPDRAGRIEVRIEPSELERTARLGQKAFLTVVTGEGKESEVIERVEVSFTRGGPPTRVFRVQGGKVEPVAADAAGGAE
ncbi:MAG: hypothetical protein JNL21_14280 [Myxococcales bacterium]|nr:hypothetical protein [Myxococcales bacterium]